VNDFRIKTLGLEPVSTLWAPGQLYRLKVPYTYMWSPGLVPKPEDWGSNIDIAGFVFLDLASSFKPPDDLVKFLEAGDKPIYIGFGSIVVDDPDKFTKMIFEAVEKAGVRALVSKGWGGLGDDDNTPDNIYMLENTPHDWLFPRVSAVVHHGGAGTTAIGLKCGKPTMIVPFFGDQQFWGNMIGESGAGADPVPYKKLDADKLAQGIKTCLSEESRAGAEKIAKRIEEEGDGAKNAVKSFHRSLVLRGPNSMRCSILEDRVAVWTLKRTNLRISALAAELLIEKKRFTWKQLRLIRHNEWNDFEGPGEPITGAGTAIAGTVRDVATGVGRVPFRIAKKTKKRAAHEKKKKRLTSRHHQHKSSGSSDEDDKEEKKSNPDQPRVHKNHQGQTGDDIAKTVEKKEEKRERKEEKKQVSGRASTETDQSRRGNHTSSHEEEPEYFDQSPSAIRKIIHRPALGQHTVSGEPVDAKNKAAAEEQSENKKQAGEDDGGSILSADPTDDAFEEIGNEVGEGVGKTAEAIARAPMDLAMAISQGFHNAPRLYGDETVRRYVFIETNGPLGFNMTLTFHRPTRITGYRSGLKAAGEEFAYGIYDGWTGVITQPYHGARQDGAIGFVKGTGMGLTGFVLKNISAIIGPFGYTMKGFHKELQKSHQPTHFIRKARILEGTRDLNELNDQERKKAEAYVDHGWQVVKEIWALMDKDKKRGLLGRVKERKERKHWRENGAFENVKGAEKVLEARRKGEDVEEVFKDQRKEVEGATEGPKRDVVDEITDGREHKKAP